MTLAADSPAQLRTPNTVPTMSPAYTRNRDLARLCPTLLGRQRPKARQTREPQAQPRAARERPVAAAARASRPRAVRLRNDAAPRVTSHPRPAPAASVPPVPTPAPTLRPIPDAPGWPPTRPKPLPPPPQYSARPRIARAGYRAPSIVSSRSVNSRSIALPRSRPVHLLDQNRPLHRHARALHGAHDYSRRCLPQPKRWSRATARYGARLRRSAFNARHICVSTVLTEMSSAFAIAAYESCDSRLSRKISRQRSGRSSIARRTASATSRALTRSSRILQE